MDSRTHNSPSDVWAEDGDVHVSGPDGVAVSLSPDAAAETSDRLLEGASEAQGQRIEHERLENEKRVRRSD